MGRALPAADPGRLHEEGAHRPRRRSRQARAGRWPALLGAAPRQVVFTSGGTEAINAAVWGATAAAPGRAGAVRRRSSIPPFATPRPVLAPVEALAVDGTGRIDVDALRRTAGRRARCPGRRWCTASGPTTRWARSSRCTRWWRCAGSPGVTVHVDAAAACGHVPIDLGALGADLVSVSAHKLGGVPGAGALVVRRGSRFEPLIVGGEQERGRRGGLEAMPALLAFGAAAAASAPTSDAARHDEAATARRAHRRHHARRARRSTGVDRRRPVGPRGPAALTSSASGCTASRRSRC